MTRERPILFSGAMVRAILDGNKTQTRRVVKLQPPANTLYVIRYHHPDPRVHYWAGDSGSLLDWVYPCPQGEVGDRLYVRETWQHSNHPLGPYDSDCEVFYRADYLDDPLGPDLERSADGIRRQWRPSIHMPRAASRIVLEVTGVRVERLQDISEDDAIAEGIDGPLCAAAVGTAPYKHKLLPAAIHGYSALWERLNGPGSWHANPWVWVIEFRRIS